MSFSQALSGLAAQSDNLKVISNNIANSQTVGFKSGSVAFADVFAGATSKVGLGTSVAAITQDFTSGDLENTGRNLDLAVAGEGFYRLEKTTGESVFSRNGQFNQDADGFLVNANGQRLTGFGLNDPNDAFSPVVVGGAPEALRIPTNDIPAAATSEVTATFNLNASVDHTDPGQRNTARLQAVDSEGTVVTVNDAGGYDANGQPTNIELDYHYSSSYTAYDSLGNERVVTNYFEKVDDNQWRVTVAMDGQLTFDGTGDVSGEALLNTYWVQFNGNGQLAKFSDFATAANPNQRDDNEVVGVVAAGFEMGALGANSTIAAQNGVVWSNGVEGYDLANAYDDANIQDPDVTQSQAELAFGITGGAFNTLNFGLDLLGSTQFNNNSVQNTLRQDGYTSGSLAGLEVLEDGTIMRNYTNEERRAAGQLVLTTFANVEGLQPDGDNAWRATNASGEPVVGIAGTGMFGTVASGVLENSNVDLAKQLVDMIVAQRAYQANSSSISTQDELLQTVINL